MSRPSAGTDEEDLRRARAEARRSRMVIRRGRLGDEVDLSPVRGEEAVLLAVKLTVECWAAAGREIPELPRASLPYRFVPRGP